MGDRWPTALWEQTRMELLLTLRRGEAVLLTLVIPVGLLLFFGSTGLFDITVEFLVPGLLTLSIISSAFVSMAIATGYERKFLVLKRLGVTPLPRWILIAAKSVSVAVIEVVQFVLVAGIAVLALDWEPAFHVGWGAAGLALGTSAFIGSAMLLAGTMRAEATLALSNGLYVVFLGLGDVIVPIAALPAALQTVARILPGAPLAAVMRGAASGAEVGSASVWSLVLWAIAAPLLATRVFTWQER
ncbi:MAG: ABC transporter permease [Acidimicrobiia bacterium]|nr:ABC transporter permease [Acidimicrobiia bacterium]